MDNYCISARELMTLQKDSDFEKYYCLIDVRDEAEYMDGFIAGAMHIPFELLEECLRYNGKVTNQELMQTCGIPTNKKIIVYCKQGNYSKEAAELLREYDYQVLELHGGYTAWLVARMEIEDNEKG